MSIEIEELIVKSDEILKKADMPDRHSFFQIEKFIIGKETTVHAQLWQIVREIQARVETFDSLQRQLEDAEDNLELLDLQIERKSREIKMLSSQEAEMIDLEIQEREINIRKLQREKKSLIDSCKKVRNKFKSLLEELSFLVTGYEKIIAVHGEMKSFDDDQAQRDMWNEKYLEEFNLRVILQRPLDPDFVKSVMCLGDDAPVKQHMTKMISNVQRQMIEQKETATKETQVKKRGK